jgi:hypothetical protein
MAPHQWLHRKPMLMRVSEARPNSALVSDACGRRSRAFFSAAQRGR